MDLINEMNSYNVKGIIIMDFEIIIINIINIIDLKVIVIKIKVIKTRSK